MDEFKLTREEKVVQWASGQHLTAYMPDEIVIGSDEDIYAFIQEHLTEEYEYCDSQYMLDKIVDLAMSAENFFSKLEDDTDD